MAYIITTRRLTSDWDARRNAWKVARKIEAYKAAQAAVRKSGNRPR
jgi:hypothetical protein